MKFTRGWVATATLLFALAATGCGPAVANTKTDPTPASAPSVTPARPSEAPVATLIAALPTAAPTELAPAPATPTAKPTPKPTAKPTPKPTPRPTTKLALKISCHPSYVGECLKQGIGDYDCAGGSGNGPNYVYSTVRVVGYDEFDLDRDNDGYGCE